MNAMPRKFACLTFFLLGSQSAWACYAPPREQFIGVDQLIADANDIAVVRVLSATPTDGGRVNYRFLVQQRLAGADRTYFSLVAGRGSGVAKDTSFDNHADPVFWAAGGGRLMTSSDCRLYPAFVVGASYLLFGEKLETHRSAEKIETMGRSFNHEDKWLKYVEAALEKHRQAGVDRSG